MTPSTALVLGGGGLLGIGWMTGVLAALEESSALVAADADVVIGTSAGSATGAAVLQSGSASTLFESMTRKSRRNAELTPTGDLAAPMQAFASIAASTAPDPERAQRFVALSDALSTADPHARRDAVESRLSGTTWPIALRVTALRSDGRIVVFGSDSGVGLVDAVTASCAVPGIWPTVSIDGATYVDGGSLSPTNAHLAEDAERVVVLAPMVDDPATARPDIAAVLDRATVISPSPTTLSRSGDNPFDPDIRGLAAVLGYDDGLEALSLLR